MRLVHKKYAVAAAVLKIPSEAYRGVKGIIVIAYYAVAILAYLQAQLKGAQPVLLPQLPHAGGRKRILRQYLRQIFMLLYFIIPAILAFLRVAFPLFHKAGLVLCGYAYAL